MEDKDLTSYCGVYWPDCIWYRNSFSTLAKALKDELKQVDFERYSSIKSPFGPELEFYQEFLSVLNFIAKNDCSEPYRIGGGCAGQPCEIMKCADKKKLEGCWQCEEMEDCDKFEILKPR